MQSIFKYLLVLVCTAFVCVSCNTTQEVKPAVKTATPITQDNQRLTHNCEVVPSSVALRNISVGDNIVPRVQYNSTKTVVKTFHYKVTSPTGLSGVWVEIRSLIGTNNCAAIYCPKMIIRDARGNMVGEPIEKNGVEFRYIPSASFSITMEKSCDNDSPSFYAFINIYRGVYPSI